MCLRTLTGWSSVVGVSAIGLSVMCGAAAHAGEEAPGTLIFADIFVPNFESGSIREIQSDATGLDTLVETGGGLRALDVDPVGGKIYWTDTNEFAIRRSNLDGSEVEDLITRGLIFPSAIALDVPRGKMYWGEQSEKSGAIWRANLDGSNPELVVNTAFHRGLAVDSVNGKIYWSTSITFSYGELWRANLDGSGAEGIVSSQQAFFKPAAVAVDPAAGKVYWTDYTIDVVRRANVDGSGMETIYAVGGNFNPRGITVDHDGGKIYWGQDVDLTGSAGKIMQAELNGQSPSALKTGLGLVNSIVFFEPQTVKEILGDLDGNGVVDGADLGLLLGAWDTDDAAADLNSDGTVDGADLGLLLGAWT